MALKVEQTYLAKSSSFNSDVVTKEESYRVSCQVNLSNGSGFTGTSALEVSNDLENWVEIPDSNVAITDMSFYDITSAAAYIRVKLIISAGSADFNIDWVKA
jgi:hypothetical protein